MGFYENFTSICKTNGISPSKAVQSIGISKSNVTHWRAGSIPKISTIKQLANILGVTISDLLADEEHLLRYVTIPTYPVHNKRIQELKGKLFDGIITPEEEEELDRLSDEADKILPTEFAEFSSFIESLGYRIELKGDVYSIIKGKTFKEIMPDDLRSLVRYSKAVINGLLDDWMSNK